MFSLACLLVSASCIVCQVNSEVRGLCVRRKHCYPTDLRFKRHVSNRFHFCLKKANVTIDVIPIYSYRYT